jgi:2-dehydro-3-deoxyphosphogluconate aldolase/(4S)-4-hydroxy-2-oxoglutarate aldolase
MTTSSRPGALQPTVLDLAPVLPVVVVDRVADAVPLAKALMAGGLPAVEVTLRTPAATDAIRAISEEAPGAVVGAGTVVTPEDAERAVAAGARFLVTPGWTPALLDALRASGVPYLPGVATAGEVMGLLEREVQDMKFFPAEASGGPAFLKSVAGPFPTARFCPTGGLTAATAPRYLALPNVCCVGGSWMLPPDAVAAGDWSRITSLAADAAALGTA